MKEELDSHGKNIKGLINSNLQVTNECLDEVSTNTLELISSLEFIQKNNDQRIENVHQKLVNLEKKMLMGLKLTFASS